MAADLTSTIKVYEEETGITPVANSPYAYKQIIVVCPDTADDGDTFGITLATYGMTTFKTIEGWTHSTSDSIVITEDPTTAVATGVLTVTIGGVTDNKKRAFLIGGY